MTTLLEITQGILSDMSGDDVNSIFDTEEAEQVARIVVSTFNAMVSNTTWPKHRGLKQLTGSSDNSIPTHMTTDSDVKEIVEIEYNKIKTGETKKAYAKVVYRNPEAFLKTLNGRDSTSSTVQTITDASGVELLILNNKAPDYYTSYDDETIIFDSFDSAVESTLQGNKTQIIAYIQPTLALLDTAVPNLPVDAVSMLIEEATSRAQSKVAEFQDVKAEQESSRQRRSMSRKNWKVGADRRYPNYGRNR